ncbi:hypothetical protein GOARA_056_00200 [Gordonia araii NBRC 100433]|uniref:Uncharacterized protein n=1 Tax=Gordonia araii NBRC 100433 TaxID=1073574 RepID=G7H348_9ACTN|nr:hypothetical protein [Gordonia araii]NNG96392.1 hypothetical protein [Gordonia araii NBRC 100433]GAB10273.1 hypothetical protein GOARA_056_00200 [Gordonia araii NBRC 100433]
MNSTTPNPYSPNTGSGGGGGLWKALAIIVIGLLALMILYPLIKSLIWLGILALAIYGAVMLFVDKDKKSG